jgi:hypothetical protein
MGLGSGIAQKSVEVSLSISAASAVAGATLVLLAGKRFGYTMPLFASFAVTIAAILCIHSVDPVVFRIAIAALRLHGPFLPLTSSRSSRHLIHRLEWPHSLRPPTGRASLRDPSWRAN